MECDLVAGNEMRVTRDVSDVGKGIGNARRRRGLENDWKSDREGTIWVEMDCLSGGKVFAMQRGRGWDILGRPVWNRQSLSLPASGSHH